MATLAQMCKQNVYARQTRRSVNPYLLIESCDLETRVIEPSCTQKIGRCADSSIFRRLITCPRLVGLVEICRWCKKRKPEVDEDRTFVYRGTFEASSCLLIMLTVIISLLMIRKLQVFTVTGLIVMLANFKIIHLKSKNGVLILSHSTSCYLTQETQRSQRDRATCCQWLRPFTASDRSRAVPSRIKPFFFYVRAIRFAFFNSGRDQSERSDFAPTKTCDETNCHAHLFTVLRGNGKF